ncbi:FtsX-like permease family protein [Lentibacillus sp. CBA3610]|uniref:ABC transporter permease n=1 Tax=Lentibacillus sp. CBA3610 TaxID=2518176 RepID=UPI001595BD32|nr:FtsX-like permease family protein [Lentibacillus sp. CBA3610]
MLSSWLVSWRNVTRHKKRFFFTLVALVLGVAVMASMLISKSTFSNLMDEQERLHAGDADFWIQSNESTFSENELEWLQQQEEVEEGVSLFNKKGFAEMETEDPAQASVRFTGISDFNNTLIEMPVKAGDVTKEGLIITDNAAELFGKEIGDQISFQDMGSLEITAIVQEGGMLNSPKTFEAAILQDIQVMVPLEELQQWTGIDKQISNFRFKVNNDTDEKQLLSAYQSELEGTDLFVQPIVADSQQNNDVEGLYYVFDLIAILSIFISSFIAFNMINTSIIERKKEIAIMKSLGYTNGNIVKLIVKEIGFLAVIGTIFGLGIGIWLGLYFQDILVSVIVTQNVSYDVVIVGPLIISAIVGIVFPFLAAAWPLYKAGKTPILKAMFETSATHNSFNKLNKFRIILGVICSGIGLIDNVWAFLFLFVGLVLLFPLWMRVVQIVVNPIMAFVFRFSGKQALRSIKQFEQRNANTAAMLAIGVSLALFMSAALQSLPEGMEEEIEATFGGDILVEKETPWTDSDLDNVQGIEDVEDANSYTEIPNVTWHTKADELREFSIISFPDINNAEKFELVEEVEGNSNHPYIYVGERALTEWGGDVGDVLTLNTPAGEQNFFVKGSVQTSHNTSYIAFVEEDVIKNELNWPHDYHLALDAVDKDAISTAVLTLESTFGEEINGINTVTLTKEQTTSAVNGMDELMQGLLLLIIAISAIGISNTLFMNTMERVKEIGTMRAIGFTKRQVQFMIIAEGLFIGFTGVIVGVLYGILVIYLNSISADAQGLLNFIVPWNSLLIAIAGGVLFTLFASWLPSISASRTSIKEAINYE